MIFLGRRPCFEEDSVRCVARLSRLARVGRHQSRRCAFSDRPCRFAGVPEKNTVALLPKTIAGEKIHYIVLDDASDTTTAVKNTRKLLTVDKVVVIVGSSISPNSQAMVDVVAESETPMISLDASRRIVATSTPKTKWVFKTPQNDIQKSTAIVEHMTSHGIKTVAFIGFADAYGEGWFQEFSKSPRCASCRSSRTNAITAMTRR
jgi:branched-chain amino acid transport system substrate-binding protein